MSAREKGDLPSQGSRKPSDRRGGITVPDTPTLSSNDGLELSPCLDTHRLGDWEKRRGRPLRQTLREGGRGNFDGGGGREDPFLKDPPTVKSVEKPKKKKRKSGTPVTPPLGEKAVKVTSMSPSMEGGSVVPSQPPKTKEGEKQPEADEMEVSEESEAIEPAKRETPYWKQGLGEMSTDGSGDDYSEKMEEDCSQEEPPPKNKQGDE